MSSPKYKRYDSIKEHKVFTKHGDIGGRLWKQQPVGFKHKMSTKKLWSEKPSSQVVPKQPPKIDSTDLISFQETFFKQQNSKLIEVQKFIRDDREFLDILRDTPGSDTDEIDDVESRIKQNKKFEKSVKKELASVGGGNVEKQKILLDVLTKLDEEYLFFSKDKTLGLTAPDGSVQNNFLFGRAAGRMTTRMEVQWIDSKGVKGKKGETQPKIEHIHDNGWEGSTDTRLFNTWLTDGKPFNGTVFQSDAEGHDLSLPFPNVAPGLKHYILETIANPYGREKKTHITGRAANMDNHPNEITMHVFANHLADVPHIKYSDFTTEGKINTNGLKTSEMLATLKSPIEPGGVNKFSNTTKQTRSYIKGMSQYNKEIASNKIPGHQTQHLYSIHVKDRRAVTEKLKAQLFEHLPLFERTKYEVEWGQIETNLRNSAIYGDNIDAEIAQKKMTFDYQRMIGSSGRDSLMQVTEWGHTTTSLQKFDSMIDIAFKSLEEGKDFEIDERYETNPNINAVGHKDIEITDHYPSIDFSRVSQKRGRRLPIMEHKFFIPREPAGGGAWAGGGE